jgi:hypothetical protein
MDVVKSVAKLANCDVATATLAVAHHGNIIRDIAEKRKRYEVAKERYERAKASAERITPQYSNELGVRVQTSGSGSDKLFGVAIRREEVDNAKDAWRKSYQSLLRIVRQCDVDADVYVAYVMHNVMGYGWSRIAKDYSDLFGSDDDARYRCGKGTVIVIAKMIQIGEFESEKEAV